MKLYISGSITGSIDSEGLDGFQYVKRMLNDLGYETVCPTDYPPATEIGWIACMQRDIGLVAQCDGVALIDDSPKTQHSHGVAIEKEVAQYMGIPVMSYHAWAYFADRKDAVAKWPWKTAEVDSASSQRLLKEDDHE